jgi:arylformamidase
VGEAYVADLPDVETITASSLEHLALPPGVTRLLLRTRNSALWAGEMGAFREDYTALTSDAAQWVVDRGIRLIGVDYLSVQHYHDGPLTHQILLHAEVVILEGLNLGHVAPGEYELLCLPLKLVGADGAPARAILRTLS